MSISGPYEAALSKRPAHIPAGVCGLDDWLLLHANDALRKILATHADLPGNALSRWLSQGVLDAIHRPNGSGQKEGAHGHMIFRHLCGKNYLLHWWIVVDVAQHSLPAPVRCFTVFEVPLDELDRATRLSRRELDSVLDFIHDGIWVIDADGITRRVNRAMERIAGIRAKEVVGRHVNEPMLEGRFKTSVTLRALEAKHTVTLFDDYDNGKRCLNTSTPVFDENGNVWRVIAAIRDITELENLQKKLSNLEMEAMAYKMRAQNLEAETDHALVGQSAAVRKLRQDIARASQSEAVTLILGETGTGKTLTAKIIHNMSTRASKPFVAVNCGAIPPSLMESELFGYEGGAFTGASRGGKPGLLEMAAGGTLLLDDIGEMPLAMQAKLLHVLDGQPLYRVGGTHGITTDARVIAATNKPLERMITEGSFREDLFYRLRVLTVTMPPLRERRDDIFLLVSHFMQKVCSEAGVEKQPAQRTLQSFLAYDWPGNVRELQSIIQSLVTLSAGEIIQPDDLPAYMRDAESSAVRRNAPRQSMTSAVEALEKSLLQDALDETGSTYKAARRLGISQSSVVRKAKKYGIPAVNETRGTASGRLLEISGLSPQAKIT